MLHGQGLRPDGYNPLVDIYPEDEIKAFLDGIRGTAKLNSPIEDEAHWGQFIDWFIDRLVKMSAVFRPAVQQLP